MKEFLTTLLAPAEKGGKEMLRSHRQSTRRSLSEGRTNEKVESGGDQHLVQALEELAIEGSPINVEEKKKRNQIIFEDTCRNEFKDLFDVEKFIKESDSKSREAFMNELPKIEKEFNDVFLKTHHFEGTNANLDIREILKKYYLESSARDIGVSKIVKKLIDSACNTKSLDIKFIEEEIADPNNPAYKRLEKHVIEKMKGKTPEEILEEKLEAEKKEKIKPFEESFERIFDESKIEAPHKIQIKNGKFAIGAVTKLKEKFAEENQRRIFSNDEELEEAIKKYCIDNVEEITKKEKTIDAVRIVCGALPKADAEKVEETPVVSDEPIKIEISNPEKEAVDKKFEDIKSEVISIIEKERNNLKHSEDNKIAYGFSNRNIRKMNDALDDWEKKFFVFVEKFDSGERDEKLLKIFEICLEDAKNLRNSIFGLIEEKEKRRTKFEARVEFAKSIFDVCKHDIENGKVPIITGDNEKDEKEWNKAGEIYEGRFETVNRDNKFKLSEDDFKILSGITEEMKKKVVEMLNEKKEELKNTKTISIEVKDADAFERLAAGEIENTAEVESEKNKFEEIIKLATKIYEACQDEIDENAWNEKGLEDEENYLKRFDEVNKDNEFNLSEDELKELGEKIEIMRQNILKNVSLNRRLVELHKDEKFNKNEEIEKMKTLQEKIISAAEKIEEVSQEEFEEKYASRVINSLDMNYKKWLHTEFIDMLPEDLFNISLAREDRFSDEQMSAWKKALANVDRINNGTKVIVVDGKKTYALSDEIPAVVENENKKNFEINKAEKELMEEEIVSAVHSIKDIPAIELRKSTKEGKIFSKHNIKEEMEALLNASVTYGESDDKKSFEIYWKELKRLNGAAKKVLELESRGKVCIVLNSYTYIIDKKEAISHEELKEAALNIFKDNNKRKESALSPEEYLDSIVADIKGSYDEAMMELKNDPEWKLLSIKIREEQIKRGIVEYVTELLSEAEKNGKINIDENIDSLARYIFDKIFEKQKI